MTLIEIMVVIVIMAIIAVAVGINVIDAIENARRQDTKVRARTIQTAVKMYLMDVGGECPSMGDLADQLDSTTEHTDAWKHDFEIECDGSTVHVRSPGPDGQLGNEDDIGF